LSQHFVATVSRIGFSFSGNRQRAANSRH